MSQQVATKGNGKLKQVSGFLDRLKAQVEMALPGHMNADRMCRLALTAFSTNKKLQNCSMQSIAACVMTSSQLGLEIGVNGQAYMIPYGTEATFVPGWKGLIDLVNRAGKSSVWTGAVFEGDFFDWQLGDSPFCTHRPEGESDPDKLLYAYSVGRLKGAEFPIIEVWPVQRLKKHFEKHNKVGAKHYAHQNWEMYCRKVVLLQVLKYLPQSVELNTAVQASHAAERMPVIDGSIIPNDSLTSITDEINGDSHVEEEPDKIDSKEGQESTDIGSEIAASLVERIGAANDVETVITLVDMAETDLADVKPVKEKKRLQKIVMDAGSKRTNELESQ